MRFRPRWPFLRSGRPKGDALAGNDVAFVLCVERNRLFPQALILCESLRTFGGPYKSARILAVSPRASFYLDAESKRSLSAFDVECVEKPLNSTGSPYGTINRIVAGAFAEERLAEPFLVVLDTDTLFVAEPEFVRADAGVRPVDVKGSASTGPDDPRDAYWARICALAGLEPDALPRVRTTIDGVSIRSSWNGGFSVVRRELGILRKTEEVFFASLAENLRPSPGVTVEVFASTGNVGLSASEWWGSSQAALAVAIRAKTGDIRIYDDRYDIPLHNLVDDAQAWPDTAGPPIHLHYHYLAEPEFRPHFLRVASRIGVPEPTLGWISDRLCRFDPIESPESPTLSGSTR